MALRFIEDCSRVFVLVGVEGLDYVDKLGPHSVSPPRA